MHRDASLTVLIGLGRFGRFAKIVRYGRTRTHIGIDVFNVINSDAILTYNQTFQLPSATLPNGSWLVPQSVLTPRFMKVSAQIDF